ncbi:hypothetical protein [Amycolatopsis sp. CA-128772]|uniref:hypothetical protein n=1 Tax=Amycolatopsis sp. CA-128772 TaxID=2073159 RepID=UPI000CD0113C|nr:hypothetical protein [Amycolatopsis sp. CA-128772]
MTLDRRHVHPDVERDFDEDLIDPAAYQARLLAGTRELVLVDLIAGFDDYDYQSFKDDEHDLTITGEQELEQFRTTRTISFTVNPDDLAGDRWQAKVEAVRVILHDVTAATPIFAMVVAHGARCTDRLKDGTDVTQYLESRSILVQVAPDTAGAVAIGAAAAPTTERPS